jgi:uncharacterized protein (TIGR00369 family)
MAKPIEYLQAMARGEAPPRPVHTFVGMRLRSAEPGRVTFEFDAQEHHYANPMGTVQGGILACLADAALFNAYFSTLEDDQNGVTLEMKINFLRPVKAGKVTAVGRLVQRGRTVGLAECDLTDDQGRLVARATATCMAAPGPARGG